MDTKNVIAAISLSAAVLILYSLFFAPEPDPSRIKKDPIKKTKVIESSEAPSLDQNKNFSKLTRKDALAEDARVQFENNNNHKHSIYRPLPRRQKQSKKKIEKLL